MMFERTENKIDESRRTRKLESYVAAPVLGMSSILRRVRFRGQSGGGSQDFSVESLNRDLDEAMERDIVPPPSGISPGEAASNLIQIISDHPGISIADKIATINEIGKPR